MILRLSTRPTGTGEKAGLRKAGTELWRRTDSRTVASLGLLSGRTQPTTEVSQLTPNIFRNYIQLKLEFSITTLSMSFLSIF